ncbi:MAG: hypothetical protein PVF83_08565 [Anaerolineales bacterium]
MTSRNLIILTCIFFLMAACEPVCPPESVTTMIPPYPTFDPFVSHSSSTLIEVEIKGKLKEVNRVIHGPLCNDHWQGVIYAACDVQVAAWEDEPTFLRDCDLNIEEGTIVYVASHNDQQFNEGCSCHE